MRKLPGFTPKLIIKILLKRGFVLDRTKGSHQIFINPESNLRVVVPMHGKDLPKGTFFSILKQAEISRDELEDLL